MVTIRGHKGLDSQNGKYMFCILGEFNVMHKLLMSLGDLQLPNFSVKSCHQERMPYVSWRSTGWSCTKKCPVRNGKKFLHENFLRSACLT